MNVKRVCTGCRYHYPYERSQPCPAKRLQGQLRRRLWWVRQYQGVITTDAPQSLIDRLLAPKNKPKTLLEVFTDPKQG